jgi:FkbM family methyltransferase
MMNTPNPINAPPLAPKNAPAPATDPRPAAKKRPFFRLPRREFFVGGLAGLIAGKAASWVQPLEWTKEELPDGTNFSFAQQGEDLVASSLLGAIGITKPSYMDIGAYDPIRSNNTYLFYRRGGRGLLVEPNVALTDKLRRKRPGDAVLVAGIGIDDTPEADYYVLSDDQLNTFDKEQVERLTRETTTKLIKVVKMPLININRVMAEHFGSTAPDYLSIDIEGLDFAVLKTLDFARFRPKVICAETLITATLRHNPDTLALMAEKGYELRGMTHPNALFVDKRALA